MNFHQLHVKEVIFQADILKCILSVGDENRINRRVGSSIPGPHVSTYQSVLVQGTEPHVVPDGKLALCVYVWENVTTKVKKHYTSADYLL